jgi:DNA gyrase subunit A
MALAEVTGRTRGTPIGELAPLEKGEQILAVATAPASPEDAPPPFMMVTAQGVMKRISVEELIGTAAAKTCINLKPGDSLAAMFPAPDGSQIVAVASNAQAMRCDASVVPVQGRTAGGVAGMKLSDAASVVGAGVAEDDAIILTVSDVQTAKVTDATEIPLKGRATAGLRVTKFRTEQRLEWAYVGPEQGVLLIVGTIDNPAKPDPSPEPLTIPQTARDLVSKSTKRRFLAIGTGRW